MKNKLIIIRKNSPEPSSEEINEMQDFNEILNGYKLAPKPKVNTINYIIGLAASIVIVVGLYLFLKPAEKLEVIQPQLDVQFIKPVAGMVIPFAIFEVESGKADTLHLVRGSKIIIPASPFLDAKGMAIKGKVAIKYREFLDPVTIAMSGIPMNYDSGGINYNFESAGMYEILGSQNEQPVFVDATHPLKIEFVSVNPDPKFNFYFLDTVQKSWISRGKPISKKLLADEGLSQIDEKSNTQFVQENSKEIQSSIKLLAKKRPQKPIEANPELPHFKLNFNPIDFPELEAYKNIAFEVDKKDKFRSIELFRINWSNISYETIESGKLYAVRMELFEKGNGRKKVIRQEKLIVHPVYEDKDYETALALFKQKDAEYNKLVNEKIETEKRLKEEAANFLRSRMSIQSNLIYDLTAEKFGVYNCDQPFLQVNSITRQVSFFNSKNDKIRQLVLYQINLGKNAIIVTNFDQGSNNQALSLSKNDPTILFTIFANGSLGYYLPEDCKELQSGNGSGIIKFRTSNKILKKPADIRKILGV